MPWGTTGKMHNVQGYRSKVMMKQLRPQLRIGRGLRLQPSILKPRDTRCRVHFQFRETQSLGQKKGMSSRKPQGACILSSVPSIQGCYSHIVHVSSTHCEPWPSFVKGDLCRAGLHFIITT